MAKKYYWEMDNLELSAIHRIQGIDEVEKFSFDVIRRKDMNTGDEVVRISAFCNNKAYGTIVTRLSELNDIHKPLSDKGIVFPTLVVARDLSDIIRKNYYCFEPQESEYINNNISDKVVEGVFELFCKYIQEQEIQGTDKYYSISVDEFKKEFENSAFRHNDISDIKEALKLGKYIYCNTGRTDHAIKENVDGKIRNKRYISFYIDKVNERNTSNE